MNFRNFQRLAWFSPTILAPVLAQLEAPGNQQLWSRYTERQDTPGSPHHDTQCIHLRGPKEMTFEGVMQRPEAMDYQHEMTRLSAATQLMTNLFFLLGASTQGQRGRCMITWLKPCGEIDEHRDEGRYAEYFNRRVHLVLSTVPNCDYFDCGGEKLFMQPGELWWFNHRLLHSAENFSETESRIHMILDYRL